VFCLILAVGIIYYFSNPKPLHHYDYTFRVAENILRGSVAFREKPPSWLNEFVPFGGFWYSVFPLGSVLTMMPFAFLKIPGLIRDMPGAFISALTASLICLFLILISLYYEHDWQKRALMISGVLFGTWMWTNLAMAGAWQLALGFAMVGELGAIYFTVFKRKPLYAGFFFALAFGNRTEILLTAPIFMFLLLKLKIDDAIIRDQKAAAQNSKTDLMKFCFAPFVLGIFTLTYNYVRFESFTDFGYARIPGVLDEPWYKHGIFSIRYVPEQAYQMLFRLWETRADFPYIAPSAFSSSVLLSSPFILFVFRFGARDKILKYSAWAAMIVLTFLLWCHGNAGGWQFGYRYAMILLPWVFLILLENSPKKITCIEISAYMISFILNLLAVYLFFWTDFIKS
jgi:hypothetical protein